MGSQKTVDLSPKIFKYLSILAAISIAAHIVIDIIYEGRVDYQSIVPSIMLFIFSEHQRSKNKGSEEKEQ